MSVGLFIVPMVENLFTRVVRDNIYNNRPMIIPGRKFFMSLLEKEGILDDADESEVHNIVDTLRTNSSQWVSADVSFFGHVGD